MNEAGKRNSTRDKKPPKYLYQEEVNPDTCFPLRISHSKEPKSNPTEITSLAKLLTKFVQSCNQKAHPQPKLDVVPELDDSLHLSAQRDFPKHSRRIDNKDSSHRSPYIPAMATPTGDRKLRDQSKRNGPNSHGKGVSNTIPEIGPKISIESHYGVLLRNHIKNELNGEGPSCLSSNEKAGVKNRAKKDERLESEGMGGSERRKTEGEGIAVKPNKVFKRQSYHAAIAYHIHLAQINKTQEWSKVDPTYYNRKFKEGRALQGV